MLRFLSLARNRFFTAPDADAQSQNVEQNTEETGVNDVSKNNGACNDGRVEEQAEIDSSSEEEAKVDFPSPKISDVGVDEFFEQISAEASSTEPDLENAAQIEETTNTSQKINAATSPGRTKQARNHITNEADCVASPVRSQKHPSPSTLPAAAFQTPKRQSFSGLRRVNSDSLDDPKGEFVQPTPPVSGLRAFLAMSRARCEAVGETPPAQRVPLTPGRALMSSPAVGSFRPRTPGWAVNSPAVPRGTANNPAANQTPRRPNQFADSPVQQNRGSVNSPVHELLKPMSPPAAWTPLRGQVLESPTPARGMVESLAAGARPHHKNRPLRPADSLATPPRRRPQRVPSTVPTPPPPSKSQSPLKSPQFAEKEKPSRDNEKCVQGESVTNQVWARGKLSAATPKKSSVDLVAIAKNTKAPDDTGGECPPLSKTPKRGRKGSLAPPVCETINQTPLHKAKQVGHAVEDKKAAPPQPAKKRRQTFSAPRTIQGRFAEAADTAPSEPGRGRTKRRRKSQTNLITNLLGAKPVPPARQGIEVQVETPQKKQESPVHALFTKVDPHNENSLPTNELETDVPISELHNEQSVVTPKPESQERLISPKTEPDSSAVLPLAKSDTQEEQQSEMKSEVDSPAFEPLLAPRAAVSELFVVNPLLPSLPLAPAPERRPALQQEHRSQQFGACNQQRFALVSDPVPDLPCPKALVDLEVPRPQYDADKDHFEDEAQLKEHLAQRRRQLMQKLFRRPSGRNVFRPGLDFAQAGGNDSGQADSRNGKREPSREPSRGRPRCPSPVPHRSLAIGIRAPSPGTPRTPKPGLLKRKRSEASSPDVGGASAAGVSAELDEVALGYARRSLLMGLPSPNLMKMAQQIERRYV